MKLVAGLGNPGKEYEHTRHNMGFDVIDELARRWAVNVWKTDMNKIPAEDIYIICDDLDLPAGKTRIRKKGSAGGHNGIKSLIAGLHTEEFVRFRIGVGHPKDGHTVIEHVLGRPYGEEIERIEAAKKYTADSVERALETTVDKAMNEFNPKRGR